MSGKRAPSIASYRDVESLLDTALAHDSWPVEVQLDTQKKAMAWAFRANTMRRILRELEERNLGAPPGTGSCRFDMLTFSLKDDRVVINLRSSDAKLFVRGKEVEILPAPADLPGRDPLSEN